MLYSLFQSESFRTGASSEVLQDVLTGFGFPRAALTTENREGETEIHDVCVVETEVLVR